MHGRIGTATCDTDTREDMESESIHTEPILYVTSSTNNKARVS